MLKGFTGNCVCALGAVLPATFAHTACGCRAGDFVNRIIALEELWPLWRIARLLQVRGEQGNGTRDNNILRWSLGVRIS